MRIDERCSVGLCVMLALLAGCITSPYVPPPEGGAIIVPKEPVWTR